MKLVATETAYKGNDLYVKEYQVQMEKTLRDEFAMAAMNALIVSKDFDADDLAKAAYRRADAMMKERSK
jgi:hypothetical protein